MVNSHHDCNLDTLSPSWANSKEVLLQILLHMRVNLLGFCTLKKKKKNELLPFALSTITLPIKIWLFQWINFSQSETTPLFTWKAFRRPWLS